MPHSTPALPARGGPPKALTGVINTVVGQIKVTTADQLPDLPESAQPAAPKTPCRLTKLETAQLMKDRDQWMTKVDLLNIEDADEWTKHKNDLKAIANMPAREKLDLFTRFRRIAESHGVAWNETKRLFFKMPVSQQDYPVNPE